MMRYLVTDLLSYPGPKTQGHLKKDLCVIVSIFVVLSHYSTNICITYLPTICDCIHNSISNYIIPFINTTITRPSLQFTEKWVTPNKTTFLFLVSYIMKCNIVENTTSNYNYITWGGNHLLIFIWFVFSECITM